MARPEGARQGSSGRGIKQFLKRVESGHASGRDEIGQARHVNRILTSESTGMPRAQLRRAKSLPQQDHDVCRRLA